MSALVAGDWLALRPGKGPARPTEYEVLRTSGSVWLFGAESLATACGEAHREVSVVHQAARSTNEQITCIPEICLC